MTGAIEKVPSGSAHSPLGPFLTPTRLPSVKVMNLAERLATVKVQTALWSQALRAE